MCESLPEEICCEVLTIDYTEESKPRKNKDSNLNRSKEENFQTPEADFSGTKIENHRKVPIIEESPKKNHEESGPLEFNKFESRRASVARSLQSKETTSLELQYTIAFIPQSFYLYSEDYIGFAVKAENNFVGKSFDHETFQASLISETGEIFEYYFADIRENEGEVAFLFEDVPDGSYSVEITSDTVQIANHEDYFNVVISEVSIHFFGVAPNSGFEKGTKIQFIGVNFDASSFNEVIAMEDGEDWEDERDDEALILSIRGVAGGLLCGGESDNRITV